MKIDFSVVIPVYNSKDSLEDLCKRLMAVLDKNAEAYEIIFVNDGSTDGSLEVLNKIRNDYGDSIVVVDLYRNFGQQNAIMCGFSLCRGEYIVTIDDDLQNPPEELPKLVKCLKDNNYDAVFGCYESKNHKKYKNLGSYFVRKTNHKIFDIKNNLKFSSYRLIKKEVIDQIKDIKTPYPYVSGMLMEVTKNVGNQLVDHQKREHGKSGYSFRKLMKLSYNLLINYSSIPLKIVGFVGLLVSVVSFIIGSVFLVRQLVLGMAPQGWTTLVVLISFYNTIILLLFFVIGEYLKRMLRESSNYRSYIVKSISR